MPNETIAVAAKFDVGAPPPPILAGELPWGYGENRITAVARDPDSAYLYWEITDEGIASARSRLGAAGGEGWCNLRIYDTTGHDFDGTNANDYFDIRVDRADREYFLMIRRPTSSMHAEVGVKTYEGFFQPIARSGRVDFPRNAPSPNTSLEWLTVTSDQAPPAAMPYQSRYAGPEPTLPGRAGAGYVDVWRAAYAPSMPDHHGENASSSGAGVHRTFDRSAHIERWWHLDEWRSEWRGGLRFTRRLGSLEDSFIQWREGPFPIELSDIERVAIELLGEPPVRLTASGIEFTVYGPWRVSIRSFEGEPHRRVLSTWSMRWVRATTPMIERWGFSVERRILSGFEREHVVFGASEQHALLERGASELLRVGASERMWMGASEWAAAGGSETLFLGATQWGFAGASAFAYGGGSEWLGGSERVRGSEWWRSGERMGASEQMGASEWMGGSERLGGSAGLGGSETLGSSRPTAFGGPEKWGGRLEEV
ncbi:MAG: DUF4912 domain-containing protein [Polyangiaceae bacterium]|nr:DUF4912 domain-containing protein [Polyangiaceae bacterium]